MRKSVWLIAAAILLAGCGAGTTDTGTETPGRGGGKSAKAGDAKIEPKEGGKYRIAVIPKGSSHEFWKAVHAGADDAANELGVEVIWKGPEVENDRDGQKKVIENFVAQKVDGMVLTPLDSKAMRPPVEAAQKAGIPVVIIDSGLESVDVVGAVMTNNEKAGALAGAAFLKSMEKAGKKGKVLVLRYQVNSASTDAREKGFLKAIKGKADVVDDTHFAGPTIDSARTQAQNLMAQYKDVDGIFCPNESSTVGMLRVLEANGMAGKVHFFGFDSSDILIQAVKDGKIEGIVVQNPNKMGYDGVKTLIARLKGEKYEKAIDTGATLVTKENISQPDIDKLVNPKRI